MVLFFDVGMLELFVVCIGVINFIIDFWIYILFWKENIILIIWKIGNFWGKISVLSSSVSNDVILLLDVCK